MNNAPQPAPELSPDTRFEIEPLCAAKVHVNRNDHEEAVLQITTSTGHLFLSVHVEELGRLGERLMLDSKLLSAGDFTGKT